MKIKCGSHVVPKDEQDVLCVCRHPAVVHLLSEPHECRHSHGKGTVCPCQGFTLNPLQTLPASLIGTGPQLSKEELQAAIKPEGATELKFFTKGDLQANPPNNDPQYQAAVKHLRSSITVEHKEMLKKYLKLPGLQVARWCYRDAWGDWQRRRMMEAGIDDRYFSVATVAEAVEERSPVLGMSENG